VVLQGSKGGVRKRGLLQSTCRDLLVALFLYASGMLMIVAIETEQLPVTAVGRIVVMVVVSVMNSQFP